MTFTRQISSSTMPFKRFIFSGCNHQLPHKTETAKSTAAAASASGKCPACAEKDKSEAVKTQKRLERELAAAEKDVVACEKRIEKANAVLGR